MPDPVNPFNNMAPNLLAQANPNPMPQAGAQVGQAQLKTIQDLVNAYRSRMGAAQPALNATSTQPIPGAGAPPQPAPGMPPRPGMLPPGATPGAAPGPPMSILPPGMGYGN